MHTAFRKRLKICGPLAFLALVRGVDGVGIPLLFVWEEQ